MCAAEVGEWLGMDWALAHPNPLTLSYSSRGTLAGCARRFEFFKFYTLPAKRETSEDMIAGTALHAGFQEYIVSGNKEAAQWAMMRSFDVANSPDPAYYRSLEACYGTLEDMMANVNLVEYQIADVICLDGQTRPGIELEFEIWLEGIVIDGRPVVYVGYIDLALFHLLRQEYAVMDMKTHRSTVKDRTAEYIFNAQCIPYSLVLQQIAEGDIDRFRVLYLDVYVDILEPKSRIFPFQKDHSDLEDWFTGLYYDLKRIKEYAERKHFPRAMNGCTFYRKPCQFLGVCQERNHEVIQGILLASTEEPQQRLQRNPWVRLILPMPSIV